MFEFVGIVTCIFLGLATCFIAPIFVCDRLNIGGDGVRSGIIGFCAGILLAAFYIIGILVWFHLP